MRKVFLSYMAHTLYNHNYIAIFITTSLKCPYFAQKKSLKHIKEDKKTQYTQTWIGSSPLYWFPLAAGQQPSGQILLFLLLCTTTHIGHYWRIKHVFLININKNAHLFMEDARLFIWFHVTQSSCDAIWYRLSLSETCSAGISILLLLKNYIFSIFWGLWNLDSKKCYTSQRVIEQYQLWGYEQRKGKYLFCLFVF